MIRTFVFLGLLSTIFCACSQTSKSTNNEKEKQEMVQTNEALIVLSQQNPDEKAEKKFPLHDTIRLPVESVTTSSGSSTSLSMKFAINDGGRANSLDLFLPAAPQLKWHPTRDGGFELHETKLPYTLKGEAYIPYENALYNSKINASAYIQSIIKSPDGSAIMYFRFKEITIVSMDFKDWKANIEMKIKLISENISDPVYGSYEADVHFFVKGFGYSMMMVD